MGGEQHPKQGFSRLSERICLIYSLLSYYFVVSLHFVSILIKKGKE